MVGLMTQVYAQNIHLSNSHNSTDKSISYIVDYLKIDSITFFSIGLQKSDIKKVRASSQEPVIVVTTNLAIAFNNRLLSTSKEKKKLSTINLADIELIQKIEKEQSIELYGKKGKNGVLVIKYKP
jgi:hypothetical protein